MPNYRQNTFTLIPNPMGIQGLAARTDLSAPTSRPMTSKQAQKAYRERTRQPRLSKAEQRRLEREEQEKIRRELEKEKQEADKQRQAARARTLRERKKVREQEIMQEKKKKGLPLVDVRPSQDTIARFVRGNGLGNKRDAAGTKVDLPVIDEDGESIEAVESEDSGTIYASNSLDQSRREMQRLNQPNSEEASGHERHQAVAQEAVIAADTDQSTAQDTSASPNKRKRVDKDEDEEVESQHATEATSFEELSASLQAVMAAATDGKTVTSPIGDGKDQSERVDNKYSRNINNASTIKTSDKPAFQTGSPLGQAATGHDKVVPEVLQVPREIPITKRATTPVPRQAEVPLIPPPQRQQSLPAQGPSLREPLQETTNALNRARPAQPANNPAKYSSPLRPPLPASRMSRPSPVVPAFKQQRPGTPVSGLQKPKFLPPYFRPPNARQSHSSTSGNKQQPQPPQKDASPIPPTSTQLFVMNHIDEFPTASQEARELQGGSPAASPQLPTSTQLFLMINIDDILPSPTQEARELGLLPADPTMAPESIPQRPPGAGFAVKTKPSPRPRQLTRQVGHVNTTVAPPSRPAAAKQNVEVPLLPFISTQDLDFSSQDVRELETPSRPKNNTSGNNSKPPFLPKGRPMAQPQPPSVSRPATRGTAQHAAPVFQTKRGPAPSTFPTVARPNPQADQNRKDNNCAQKQVPIPKDKQTPATNKPAAQSESPGAAAQTTRPPSPEKPRFFGPSGQGLEMLKAINQSKITHQEEEKKRQAERAAQEEANLNKASQETDYGGEELDEISLSQLLGKDSGHF